MKQILLSVACILSIGAITFMVVITKPDHPKGVSTKQFLTSSVPNAFGELSASSLTPRSANQAAVPMLATKDLATTSAGSGAVSTSPSTITFIYTAGDFTIPSLPVLRRDVTLTPFQSNSLKGLPSVLSIDSFSNLRLDSMTLTEQGSDGYTISIDTQRGTTSLYRQSFVTNEKMMPSSVNSGSTLSSTEALTIAQTFLDAHGISKEHFGTPIVEDDNYFTMPMAQATDTIVYSPVISVVYPWIVQGTPVVDQSGFPYGLTITIDSATQSVSGASNITDLQFTASQYSLVTDPAAVLAVAKRGGLYQPASVDGTTNGVPLSAPTPVYMISSYQLSNDGTDYLVPALWFAVKDVPISVTLYQKGVVVPLIESLLTGTDTTILPSATTGNATVTAPARPLINVTQ